jgi:hypothetical protein
MQPHNHTELIKLWAAGSDVQRYQDEVWVDDYFPSWLNDDLYRLKAISPAESSNHAVQKNQEA